MEIAHEITSGSPVAILFVDDETNVLQALRRLFMDEDYVVISANSGEEAVEILKNNQGIGLIVSDQRMPGMKGAEFLEKAKELAPDAIRILLTGYADISAVADAINKGGAYRYITKPWNDEDLLQVIADAVKRYSLIKENRRLQEIVNRQNEELKKWNSQLEHFVQEQTIEIQDKNKELEKLNEGLKSNFKNSIIAFSGLVELRDRKTANHSKNVAELSVKIARAMDLPDKEIETVTAAALLHDIGKIGIPDALITREIDEMDKEERNEYMQHPVRGQAAIDSIEDLRAAGVLIRHHHEWFNGFGFPDGLSAGKIPLGARIIAVADFMDKTIKKDPENTVEAAIDKLRNWLGTRFDSQILPYLEAQVRSVYAKLLTKHRALFEAELGVNDLKEGMVLSRDVKSGTGLVLLTRGSVLNFKSILSLRRYYDLDPSKSGIFVVVKK
ncbi:MAG: response regulator [Nitrospirae bacterium]|nr:response regulator [Nitrospirota bacterium]